MSQTIGHITLVVDDYDRAIEFYTKKMNFVLQEDTRLTEDKRWVLVSPKGNSCSLLLAKAASPEQQRAVGNQTGGRVFLFLHTDNFQKDYDTMKSKGVVFLEEPRSEEYGLVVVFQDIFGNKWDLLQLK